MLQIIYAEDTHRIVNYAKKRKVVYPFIWVASCPSDSKEILCAHGMREIDLYEPGEREKIDNEQEYISTISMLGSMYNPIEWWAHGVSEKNEHTSSHYKNIVRFCCLIKTLKSHSDITKDIFVIGNSEIYKQLKDYCHKNRIKILSLENPIIAYIKKILIRSRFCISVLKLYIRTVLKKLYVDYVLGASIKEKIDGKEVFYVIRTRLDARFLEKERYLQDTLFGSLPYHALRRGYKVLILARISDDSYSEIVKKIKNTKNILIIPEDYFLGCSDLWRSWKRLHFKKRRFTKKIVFDDSRLDVTKIYEEELNKGYFTTEYIRNIITYFIAKNFAQDFNFKVYVQTFENYAWEKMIILGIKENKSDCKILGFQHAFISRNSFKYFPGDMNKVPLPDKIITIGAVNRDVLSRFGGYNENILTTGCALRQEYIADTEPFKRRYFRRMVVPLTMARDESILILKFLYDSGLPGTENIVIIRCHPCFPFEKFERQVEFKIPDNFIINNERTVKAELTEASMVLYTWSTVAMEALKLGLPVVYLDILKPMYVDPLFECNALKRTVARKEELLSAINDFYSMPDEIFYREQKTAQRYLKGYFYPVNAETLTPFFV